MSPKRGILEAKLRILQSQTTSGKTINMENSQHCLKESLSFLGQVKFIVNEKLHVALK